MLQVFYLDVAYIFVIAFQVFLGFFANVLDACFKCFICLRHMLQMFHLYVSKVDQVLHMLQ